MLPVTFENIARKGDFIFIFFIFLFYFISVLLLRHFCVYTWVKSFTFATCYIEDWFLELYGFAIILNHKILGENSHFLCIFDYLRSISCAIYFQFALFFSLNYWPSIYFFTDTQTAASTYTCRLPTCTTIHWANKTSWIQQKIEKFLESLDVAILDWVCPRRKTKVK